MAALDDPGADDPARLELVGLVLHPLHRELARLVQRLRVVGHLDVPPDLLQGREHPLAADVVDAVAHHQPDGAVAGPQQLGEVLPAQVGGERPPVRRAVKLAAAVLDRGSDRDELGEVGAPFVASDVEPDADDAVRAELVGLLLHPRHRELARVVHRLGQHAELLTLIPHRLLEPDVVDRAAEHEPERLEPGLLDQQELVDREVAGEEPACDVLLHPRDPLAARLRGCRPANPPRRSRRAAPRSVAGPGPAPARAACAGLVVVVTLQESHRSSYVTASAGAPAPSWSFRSASPRPPAPR